MDGLRTSLLLACLAAALCPGVLLAASGASAPFPVAATVEPRCAVQASSLTLGPYDPFVANANRGLSGATRPLVQCTEGVTAKLLLEPSESGPGLARVMRSGKEELRYVLFRDEARERAWVAGEEGAVALVAESARSPLGVPVVVWVPPGQVVLAGWYTDVVTARLEF